MLSERPAGRQTEIDTIHQAQKLILEINLYSDMVMEMRFQPDTKLHSREHVLADDLSRMMNEPKKFASYLGIAKRYHESDLRELAGKVLEKNDLPKEARGKYFFASLRTLKQKSKVKRTIKKKRTKKYGNRKNTS